MKDVPLEDQGLPVRHLSSGLLLEVLEQLVSVLIRPGAVIESQRDLLEHLVVEEELVEIGEHEGSVLALRALPPPRLPKAPSPASPEGPVRRLFVAARLGVVRVLELGVVVQVAEGVPLHRDLVGNGREVPQVTNRVDGQPHVPALHLEHIPHDELGNVEARPPRAGDKILPRGAEVTPVPLLRATRRFGQRELRERPPRRWIESQAATLVRAVDSVPQRDVVAADRVGPGLVAGVVVACSDALERALPQESTGVDVHRPDHVAPLYEEAPGDDMGSRAVSVAREDASIRRASEPEKTERRLHDRVPRHHAVG